MGACNCSMFCCTLPCVHSSIAIILMGKRELVALLNLSSWCLVMVERLFLALPQGCLRFVIVVFPDHTHLLILKTIFFVFFQWPLKTDFTVPNFCSVWLWYLLVVLTYFCVQEKISSALVGKVHVVMSFLTLKPHRQFYADWKLQRKPSCFSAFVIAGTTVWHAIVLSS